ncbi:hypothetical protein [Lachnotalea glycerini]|uniref:Uncharacterized protein n=1 Tax=Lachnotalea glycerini TaxID=1763509 RepID=A0A371JBN2_9FIRM|nr:hypothetical protein [Lachnotalea glycerini]RDY30165.1 hypothetical protein CG710_016125 [Lachnotalea glycerini]
MSNNNNEIEIARKKAFSIKGSSSGMKYIGYTEDKDGRVSIFYKDANGDYWFESYKRVDGKLITEEEHIFGRKLKPIWRKKKYY